MNEETELNLVDYLKVLYRQKKMIMILVFSATLIILIYTLLSPKIYQATATLLPTMDHKDGGLGMDLAKVSQFASGFISTPTTSTDLFLSMLKSRTMAEAVIDKFDLLNVYRIKSRELAIRKLQADTRISLSKEKVISIVVETPAPKLSADIANYYIEYLDLLNRTLSTTSARRNRQFIEQRLNETKTNLVKLEDVMEKFQTKHKTVSLEHQAKAAIDAAAELQSKLTAGEVQLQVMQNYLSSSNPDVIKQEMEVKELSRQIRRMEYGAKAVAKEYKDEGTTPVSNDERLNPAFVKMPGLGLNLARLTREVKVQETLYTLLISQFEQAKIQEARDTPTVQPLDKAVAPERKSKPSIRGNVMLAFFASALSSIFIAFFLDYLETVKKGKRKFSSS